MECSEFEAMLQERLDRRLPLPLGDAARAHLRQCSPCEQDYRFFQQLGQLTQQPTTESLVVESPTGRSFLGPTPSATPGSRQPSSADNDLEQVIGRCVAALGADFHPANPRDTRDTNGTNGTNGSATYGTTHQAPATATLGSDVPIPLAPTVSLPKLQPHMQPRTSASGHGRAATQPEAPLFANPASSPANPPSQISGNQNSNARSTRDRWAPLAAIVTAAVVLLTVGGLVWRWNLTDHEMAQPTTVEATPPPAFHSASAGAEPGLVDARPVPLVTEDLREFTKNWDDSVVAFDRGWQQMAVGRVRAHQIPGMQPAVYPITGAVEAFRKTWIRRNPDGLAAGLQW